MGGNKVRTGKQNRSAIIVGNIIISLPITDYLSKQKINMNGIDLKNTINQLDLIDIYRRPHQITDEYTLFSSSNGTFTETDPILGHKKTLNCYNFIN